ncbi:MAG: hypothetical protein KDE27_28035 [Planctomycetes bacterium]|nr:hypothetical protein [Planctomycetota bacterium]
MNRRLHRPLRRPHAAPLRAAFYVLLGLTAAACSSGSDNTGGLKTGGNFIVLRTEPETNGQLYLNDPIRIDFSNPVNLASVNLNTFTFQVFDQLGNGLQENVAGTFRLATSPGDDDAAPKRRLEFVPRFPTNDTFDNGGFKPGRRYLIQLVGGDRVNGTVLRDTGGRGLLQPVSFQFATAEGTTPSQLFRNTVPGGPRRVELDVTPQASDNSGSIALNKSGAPPVEVRLRFDQPLNPKSTNIPVKFDPDPLVRSTSNRGNVFLEYDDVTFGPNRWIPAEVELEVNDLTSSTLLLRPVGVLPNNATIRVIVESSVADISGESNVSNAAYNRIFGSFQTQRAYEQQFDALIEEFADSSNIDFAAPFGEPVAEVGPGYVRAGFDFEGTATNLEFEPVVQNVVLNTNFTIVTPKAGAPYNVSGGVFNFKNVKINENVKVQGQGTNPMVFLVSGTFEVAGELSVSGGDGELGDSIGAANFPNKGGFGACGGGTGGDGSPSATLRDSLGGIGNGPLESPLSGGVGGNLACIAGCGRGAGGGGGALATQGDPNFPAQIVPTGSTTNPVNSQPIFPQIQGRGGQGCTGAGGQNSRQLDGGASALAVFVDSRNDNNFWGAAINVNRNLRIAGELSVPIGGGGGGGGGDLSYNNSCTPEDPNFANDSTGGGGGGGGGVLVVKALSDIIIRDTGKITANGGNGGGGELAGATNKGGGGGGGAGGMVVLMSASRIQIYAHGDNFGDRNYDFAISADGGVCKTRSGANPTVLKKYPANGQLINGSGPSYPFQSNYDAAPLGAFGGMGIVQLMAPPGPPAGQTGSNADSTNTILDDNIEFWKLGVSQTGTVKINGLAWRGFPNSVGQYVDDSGNPTPTTEGDIRPAPTLMPTPFAVKSRLRSKWIDTGASVRRSLTTIDNLPRGILAVSGAQAGPRYQFTGTNPTTGYVIPDIVGETATPRFPTIGSPAAILATDESATFLGQPAYVVSVAPNSFPQTVDTYAQFDAELLDGSDSRLGSFRILRQTDSTLTLSTESGSFPAEAASVRLRAKFFEVRVDGVESLGGTYPGTAAGTRAPISNIRIGFAFHTNPASSAGVRYPAQDGTYVYDLEDPAVQDAIRVLGAAFVQYDLLFDGQYLGPLGGIPPALSSDTPRPELHFLRLPMAF